MIHTFKLAVFPKYGQVSWQITGLTFAFTIPLVIAIFLFKKGVISPENKAFEISIIIYLFTIVFITIFAVKRINFTDQISLTTDSIIIPKMSTITFNEITSYKTITIRGFSAYLIILKDGKKIAFMPHYNFSKSASKTFQNFILSFEKRMTSNL